MRYYSIFLILILLASCKEKESTTNPPLSGSSYQDISVDEAKSLLDTGEDIIFLDVRTPEEIAEGFIEGTKAIDYRGADFEDKVKELDHDKTYVVYCRSGGRSAKASSIMKAQGFKDVKNMEGGYTGWKEKYP